MPSAARTHSPARGRREPIACARSPSGEPHRVHGDRARAPTYLQLTNRVVGCVATEMTGETAQLARHRCKSLGARRSVGLRSAHVPRRALAEPGSVPGTLNLGPVRVGDDAPLLAAICGVEERWRLVSPAHQRPPNIPRPTGVCTGRPDHRAVLTTLHPLVALFAARRRLPRTAWPRDGLSTSLRTPRRSLGRRRRLARPRLPPPPRRAARRLLALPAPTLAFTAFIVPRWTCLLAQQSRASPEYSSHMFAWDPRTHWAPPDPTKIRL